MNQQICHVTVYQDMAENTQQIYQMSGYPINAVLTEMHRLDETIRMLLNQGVKVIITRGSLVEIIRRQWSVPVVETRYSLFDFYEPLKRAGETGKKVALMGWYANLRDFTKYRDFFPKDMEYIEFEHVTAQEYDAYIEAQIQKARAKGVEIIVGGGGVAQVANRLNMPFLHVDVSREAYLAAAEEAQSLLKIYEEKERRYRTTEAIMNSVSEGILAIDVDGEVTNRNSTANQILKIPAYHEGHLNLKDLGIEGELCRLILEGKELTNRFFTLGSNKILINAKNILIDGQLKGAVITLQATDVIRNLEKKIRLNAIQSGHFAKYSFEDIAGSGFKMSAAKKRANQYAKTNSTVLIGGETGTGKEVFAQSIHNASPRSKNPFVAINCAAIPESILESELFGYVKGAFTGARTEGKPGIFELAHKGTIFLDEIGEISPKVQARLLRVLQEKELTRVGDDKVIPIDVRVIAASNKDLKAEIKAGAFREDLYYRLCVLSLTLPPLRERPEDIMETLETLIQRGEFGEKTFTPEAQALISAQPWPGNIRELGNFAERICVMFMEPMIDETAVITALDLDTREQPAYKVAVQNQIRCVDGDYILSVLKKNLGNRSKTAKELGISTSTLWRRLKEIEPQ